MKRLLAILLVLVSQCVFGGEEHVTLDELLTDTNRAGWYLLNQGFRGNYTNVFNDWPGKHQDEGEVEFTHGWFQKNAGGRSLLVDPAIGIRFYPTGEMYWFSVNVTFAAAS